MSHGWSGHELVPSSIEDVDIPEAESLDQISNVIGPDGGTLRIPVDIANDDIAQLEIPLGALDKSTKITLSIVSPATDHPPLGDKFIIAPIVRLEPDGLQFLRPVTLTVKHAAVNLALRHLDVWTKNTGRDKTWKLVMDGQTGSPNSLLTKDVAKIRITHCCLWCWLGRSKLRVQILPFVPVDLRTAKQIGLTVYASKSYDVQYVHENMAKINNVICLDSVVKVYDIGRHQELDIDIKDITDKNNTDAWKVKETPKKITADDINTGIGNACCRFDLTPVNEIMVDSVIATLMVQTENNDPRGILGRGIEVYIKHIMKEPTGVDATGTKEPTGANATGTLPSSVNDSTNTNTNEMEASASYERNDQPPNTHQIMIQRLILDDAKDVLYENLNTNNIITRLRSRYVLSDYEVACINRIHGIGERVNMLLAILKAKDFKEHRPYDEFMSALHEFDVDLYRVVKGIEGRYPTVV
ncbi:uncharacterized protein [Amphiura filiformis]|uniref:uncharacterized protein n=1 Tax=Amphiura filiformis TaxID=82378 RepID=UPI003B21EE62